MKNNWQIKKLDEICVYCGNPAEDEDHIPSRNLYKGVAKNIKPIKVPSCKKCNKSFSKDEVFFRDLIVGSRYDYSLTATQLFNTAISRSIRRNPSLGWQMFKQMSLVNLKTPSGIYLGKKTAFKFTSQDHSRVFNVLDKYIKGLFFYQFNKVLPKDWIIKHFWMTKKFEQKVLSTLRDLTWKIINENIFAYGCNWVPNTNQSIWCLVFFGKPFFYSFVLDPVTAKNFKIIV